MRQSSYCFQFLVYSVNNACCPLLYVISLWLKVRILLLLLYWQTGVLMIVIKGEVFVINFPGIAILGAFIDMKMVKMNPLLLTSCSFKLTALLWDPQLLCHIFFIFFLKCICRIAKKIPFFRWEKGLYFIALNIFLQGRYLFLWSILLFKDIPRVIEMQILSTSFFL